MSEISIGGDQRPLGDVDANWIIEQINGRRRMGEVVCVAVAIRTDGADIRLTTPACVTGQGGGRAPLPREREILDIWRELGLDENDFSAGNVVAFVKRVRKYL
jgi:hypothetical protein